MKPPIRCSRQKESNSPELILQRFLDMMEELVPSDDLTEILTRAVVATNRFLGAERGGLFWFRGAKKQRGPSLRAACNLTEKEVNSEEFRFHMGMIRRSYGEGRPLMCRPKEIGKDREAKGVQAILCLPVEVGGMKRGVLYHDNAYLDDCFDFLDGPTLVRLVGHVSLFIDRIWGYARTVERKSTKGPERTMESAPVGEGEILGRSSILRRLLTEAERIAWSESIVLLLGETGVGKELVARWIHERSPRKEGSYVVIDTPTIPADLWESELFGHEKGAFTAGGRQGHGRNEGVQEAPSGKNGLLPHHRKQV